MTIPPSLKNNVTKILYTSLNTDNMVRVTQSVIQDYNLHERSGIRESMVIPPMDAANQISKDIYDEKLFLPFLEALAQVDRDGIMGRPYPMKGLRELIKAIIALGYIYDPQNNIFLEDSKKNKTPGWGRLLDGQEYNLTFWRVDVVGNSKLVRKYSADLIQKTYQDLRNVLTGPLEKRLGRIWSWEGDGGLGAFLFGHRAAMGVCSAIEALHSLVLYNRMSNPLDEPIMVRMALHTGVIHYIPDVQEMKKQEVFKILTELESSCCAPGQLVISNTTEAVLDRFMAGWFKAQNKGSGPNHFVYAPRWESVL